MLVLIIYFFFVHSIAGQTARPVWSRNYYTSSTSTNIATPKPLYESNNRNRESVSSGTSDSRYFPQGRYKWFNTTWHWADNRTHGYDPDLDGPTLPPIEADKTYDEEEWDGKDLTRVPNPDELRHPLGRSKD